MSDYADTCMESQTKDCFRCGRSTTDVKLRAGRGKMWLCEACNSEFCRQCRQMNVAVPDDLPAQIAEYSARDDPGRVDGERETDRTDHTSLEEVLKPVPGIGTGILENLGEHGFTTPEDIQNASEAELRQVAGIGAKLAARIDSHLSDSDANESDESDSSGLGDLFG
ncbi:hypothetical protein DVK00_19100 [Haloarcula sp. Atlit-47R]|nr:hypothetical protein DVK00_19100 [Haloarcula sp. Atlit-47R]